MIFKNIGVVANEKKDPGGEHIKKLTDYLAGKNINIHTCENHSGDGLYKICDLFIVLGGDGTMLKIASKAAAYDIPVIGVNLGRIGFMSEVKTDKKYLLENLFTGGCEIKSRMMLNVEIIKNGETQNAGTALNDAVVTNGTVAKLIETEIVCDDVKITNYRADGVIVATPTGSTAYSMSAGGPIIDPNIECFCVTPICPHSLVNRPLIFSRESVLKIINKSTNSDVYLTIDGQINIKLGKKDIVKIKKSNFAAKLITIKKHGFFDVVRKKISENF
jgi:NAD+ kinase